MLRFAECRTLVDWLNCTEHYASKNQPAMHQFINTRPPREGALRC